MSELGAINCLKTMEPLNYVVWLGIMVCLKLWVIDYLNGNTHRTHLLSETLDILNYVGCNKNHGLSETLE